MFASAKLSGLSHFVRERFALAKVGNTVGLFRPSGNVRENYNFSLTSSESFILKINIL